VLRVDTTDLELLEAWLDGDPDRSRVRVTFPINKWVGSRDSAVVYFEVEPGNRLPRHTDSAEEILYLVSGEAEAEVGDERSRLTAGDLAVIPSMVPHGLVNVGEDTLRVIGFFSEAEVISSFDEPVQPVGVSVLNQGAPAPAPARGPKQQR
jgi:quercetin dioxygenase-like cupin family protein